MRFVFLFRLFVSVEVWDNQGLVGSLFFRFDAECVRACVSCLTRSSLFFFSRGLDILVEGGGGLGRDRESEGGERRAILFWRISE